MNKLAWLAILAILTAGVVKEGAAFDTRALCQGGGCCHLAAYTEAQQCEGYEESRTLESLMTDGNFNSCDYLKERPDVKWPSTSCLLCRSRLICKGDTYNAPSS